MLETAFLQLFPVEKPGTSNHSSTVVAPCEMFACSISSTGLGTCTNRWTVHGSLAPVVWNPGGHEQSSRDIMQACR
jgi:hypothetical protein